MRAKTRVLDLFCGAGLAAIGYHLAGCEVVGVDINPQPRYPFRFIEANALSILDKDYHNFLRSSFDFVHASPPCQQFSVSTAQYRAAGKKYPDLIADTRALLDELGLPYCIENVPNAPIRPDIRLRGDMFGLPVWKIRHFELGGWWSMQHSFPTKKGSQREGDFICIYGKGGYRKHSCQPVGWRPKFDQGSVAKTWAFAMGIPSGFGPFKDTEISLGIPPAYTKHIITLWHDKKANSSAHVSAGSASSTGSTAACFSLSPTARAYKALKWSEQGNGMGWSAKEP